MFVFVYVSKYVCVYTQYVCVCVCMYIYVVCVCMYQVHEYFNTQMNIFPPVMYTFLRLSDSFPEHCFPSLILPFFVPVTQRSCLYCMIY